MSHKPPSFGDVYEWDVPTGTVRWMVVAPALNEVPGMYEALLLQSTPQFSSDPALNRVTTVGIDDNIIFPRGKRHRLAEGTQ